MGIALVISFVFYTLLSWAILFRDAWTLEVLRTKFYPGQAALINQIELFLQPLKLNTIPTLLFAVFAIFAFIVYFLALRKRIAASKILIFSLLFQIIVFFSYPILSTDVLSYILSDRIAVVYHQSVWTTKPNVFNHDPYYYLVYPIYAASDWTNQTRIYGPVNQVIYSAVTAISGNDFLTNLAAHKLVVLVFNLLTMALVYKILKEHFPDKLNFSLVLLFWNPLFILETVGSGHNDILMVFFMLLSYLFYLGKKPILVALALALAVNVKSTALLLATFYTVVFPLTFFAPFCAFAFAGFLTMGVSLSAFIRRTAFSTTLYWQSLPQQVARVLPFGTRVLTPVFLVIYAFQCLRGWLTRRDPLVLYGQAILFYLLFALGAYWNWYSLWVLTAFAFLGRGLWSRIAAAFTFTSALAYPLYWLSLRFNYQHPLWPVIIYLVIAGGPVGVFLYDKVKAR
ncbi:MAG: hypothetical protein M1484_00500 [Patescibacteria group bacterium]|nr:hypothetical protein [Patescibacteria group bacterium]MCL5431560.1 hypothetical protein [Patescibacteria group bacterium]